MVAVVAGLGGRWAPPHPVSAASSTRSGRFGIPHVRWAPDGADDKAGRVTPAAAFPLVLAQR